MAYALNLKIEHILPTQISSTTILSLYTISLDETITMTFYLLTSACTYIRNAFILDNQYLVIRDSNRDRILDIKTNFSLP